MSFSEVKAAEKRGRITVGCNRVARSLTLRLMVNISRDVARDLGAKAGDRFKLYRGHAEHAQTIRIEPAEDGPFQFNRGSHGVVRAFMDLDCPEALPDGPRKPRPAAFNRDDGGAFTIHMPDWFGRQGGNHGNEEKSRAA